MGNSTLPTVLDKLNVIDKIYVLDSMFDSYLLHKQTYIAKLVYRCNPSRSEESPELKMTARKSFVLGGKEINTN
jgi:hypothetical protein